MHHYRVSCGQVEWISYPHDDQWYYQGTVDNSMIVTQPVLSSVQQTSLLIGKLLPTDHT